MKREEMIKQSAIRYVGRYYDAEKLEQLLNGKKQPHPVHEAPLIKAFIAGAEWADANQPNPWISVKERLPEEHTNVIVTDGSNVAHCRKYGDGFYTNVGKCCNVTHWMPIPELPKEEGK